MSYKIERVNSELTKAISTIINNTLKDPRITEMVTVTKVDTAKDMKTAKVYLSLYGNAERCQDSFDAIVHSGGFIRKELSHMFKQYRTLPELTFFIDDSMAYSQSIEKILDDIKKHDNH